MVKTISEKVFSDPSFYAHDGHDEPIIKTNTGFSQECDLMTLEWDYRGKYRGQWQDDMIGDEGRIFIGPDPTGKCFVADLTESQMRTAAR